MKKPAFIIIFAVVLLALGWQSSQAQVLSPTPRDGVYDKIHYPNRRVVPYSFLREADVMFARRIWRKIDLREKINQPLYYPTVPTNQRKNLITLLMDALLTEQSIKAYTTDLDDFRAEMTSAEVANIGVSRDSQQLQRPYPPYDWYDTVLVTTFDPTNVKTYKIKEDWIFDKQRSVLEPRIIGICPVMNVYDKNTGEFRGFQDMYWLYFPEVRKVLINEEVYNPYNFGQRLTYDDVFMKRQFSSLIYKVDNTYDRRIDEYIKGIDALLEAEDIKTQLKDFEHNLWEQ
ncbi:MAG: gliding motility protein GldN [Candidatus Competibacteraceae bacterium]|nr:gliding motility protein GldN [Candidatus Competibacteraceae bacterium]